MSQVDWGAGSCSKRRWADSEVQGIHMYSLDERDRKMHRRSCNSEHDIAASPDVVPEDQSRSATSCGSACCEDDDFADQVCVSETIKSLEAELGIRTDQEASSCSRNEDRLGIYGTVQLLSDPCSAESELLSWEDDTGDSLDCSPYSESSCRDGAFLPESFTSDHSQLNYSFLLEMLDDELGLLHNLSSEHLQALTRFYEPETICTFQSFSEETYTCTHSDEDIWGLRL